MMCTRLKKRMDNGAAMRKGLCRMMFGSLGLLICGLLGIPGVEATLQKFPQEQTGSMENRALGSQPRKNHVNRRDPFRPIKKSRSISSSSRKSQSTPTKSLQRSNVKDPKWTLLGIIHGPSGRQAVIQISPGKRVFVRPGLELAQSGWLIKTISKGEVLLEHFSTISSRAGLSPPKTFILSFPTLGKSQ